VWDFLQSPLERVWYQLSRRLFRTVVDSSISPLQQSVEEFSLHGREMFCERRCCDVEFCSHFLSGGVTWIFEVSHLVRGLKDFSLTGGQLVWIGDPQRPRFVPHRSTDQFSDLDVVLRAS